jgi:hypothetical protein
MATVMPVSSPAAPVVPGVLAVDHNQLEFISIRGGYSIRTFVITANYGPVTRYTIVVPPGLPGRVTVSPSSGSLAEGGSATIMVFAASTVPFATSLTVYPGGIGIGIGVYVKVKPSPGDLQQGSQLRRLGKQVGFRDHGFAWP